MNETVKAIEPAARVHRLVEEVLTGTPHFVVDVNVRGAAGSRVVAVFIDSDEGLTVDAIAQISRDLAFLLDTEAVIGGGYRLDVSSPGVDRPLKLPRQYRKNIGRVLRVHYRRTDGEGATETLGTLGQADEKGIVVVVDGQERRQIAYDDILWAKVQLPW